MPMKRKLTYATAQKIREYREQTGKSAAKIVRDFNLHCSDSVVDAILVGRTYRTRIQNYASKAVLSPQQVKEVKGRLKLGQDPRIISIQYKVSFSTIQRIKYGLTWRNTG